MLSLRSELLNFDCPLNTSAAARDELTIRSIQSASGERAKVTSRSSSSSSQNVEGRQVSADYLNWKFSPLDFGDSQEGNLFLKHRKLLSVKWVHNNWCVDKLDHHVKWLTETWLVAIQVIPFSWPLVSRTPARSLWISMSIEQGWPVLAEFE